MGMHDGHAFVTGLLVLLGHGFGMFAASGKSAFSGCAFGSPRA